MAAQEARSEIDSEAAAAESGCSNSKLMIILSSKQ